MLRLALASTAALLTVSCGGGDRERAEPAAAAEGPVVAISTSDGSVEVPVEVADSAEERRVGLMNRPSLRADAGMLFVFDEATRGGFWMKDTLIPLSIAFLDARGRILRILDMRPCRADPCPIYDPGVAYVAALEVNRGAFRRWGVSRGDVAELPSGVGG